MKKISNFLAKILAVIIICSISTTSFASSLNTSVKAVPTSTTISVSEDGIFINGKYYSQEQFTILLNNAIEFESPSRNFAKGPVAEKNSAAALIAGTWYIPGIGEIVITALGVIVIAGVAIEAGSWIYDTVSSWFATRAFNKSAENAVNNCDANKQNHIMQSKHNWNKFNKDPKWTDVAPILIKVLKEGNEQWEKGNQYIRTLIYKGETVVVRFIKDAEGLISYISTAWTK